MKLKRILWFFLGAACFLVSQPFFRIPILQLLQKSTGFTLTYFLNPLLIGSLIALSAGVFEESFRFLFKRFFLKPGECEFLQPILFGLGHGLAEVVYLLGPALSYVHISQMGMAFLERGLAVILHITLTIVVWNGFQKKQRILYLVIAILIHGLVDALIPLFSSSSYPILFMEGSLAIIDLIMVGYAYRSRKYYFNWRKNHEEIKV